MTFLQKHRDERFTLHVKIRFPLFLYTPHQITEEANMDWFVRLGVQWHIRLVRSPIAFLDIAFIASCDKIFPCILPTTASWHYMIKREI